MEGELWKALLRLVVFLPLILLLAYWSIKLAAVRGPFSQNSKNIQLVERLPLGVKNSICVIKVTGQYYLMGVSEQRVELLKELPDYQEADINNPLEWQKLLGRKWLRKD